MTEREAGSSCSHLFLLLLLLHRIIPFQRPLKIKELLQKVTEAFGQQMDMFFMEKEVKERQKRLLHVMPTLMRLLAIITEQPVMEMSCVFLCLLFRSSQLLLPLKTQEDLDQAVLTLSCSSGINSLLRILLKTPKNSHVSSICANTFIYNCRNKS